LEGRDGGYVLAIDPQDIDFERFTRLAKAGHDHLAGGRIAEAAVALREGLGLGRGAALADFAFDEVAQAPRTRLEEMRLAAIEDRIDADLAAGRHEAVAAELEGLVHEHGLRERLWYQLMLRCTDATGNPTVCAHSSVHASCSPTSSASIRPGVDRARAQALAHDLALNAPVTAERTVLGLSNIHPSPRLSAAPRTSPRS
jgi:hypothetical protein